MEKHIIDFNEKIYHVGNLDIKKQRSNSYEGNALSISSMPDTWRKIARLKGDTYILKKKNIKFMDIHNAKEDILYKKNVINWGISNNYVKKGTAFKISWYDEDIGDEVFSLFDNYEKAKNESYEDENIEKIINYNLPTQKLSAEINNKNPVDLLNTLDYLFIVYAKNKLNLDGFWFYDEGRPEIYSAPRGGIFNIEDWNICKIENNKKLKQKM